ncbi:hypothetical protein Tco_0799443 [Tanacetum coccineum]|uniref:Uncharacterized protein n=1 Tax=Tanacetum coccineum TaxID=301880 RepID=A0ABQ4ZQB8_9ASTR
MNVSPIPTTRIHKDHPKDQIIGDINSATQTRKMTKISEEHVMVPVLLNPGGAHFYVVKRIFRYLKGQPKLGLWYPMDSPFDLEAFLIQTIVANSTTEAEYVAAANCQDSYEKKLIQVIKITDHNVADLLIKAFDVSSQVDHSPVANEIVYKEVEEQNGKGCTTASKLRSRA